MASVLKYLEFKSEFTHHPTVRMMQRAGPALEALLGGPASQNDAEVVAGVCAVFSR